MTKDTVQRIQANISRSKEILELNTSIERLFSNRDFKKVILEGYFRDEAVRLVHLKVDPSMQTPQAQASINFQIDAIGGLSEYFRNAAHNASVASKSIQSDEAEIEVLQSEELN